MKQKKILSKIVVYSIVFILIIFLFMVYFVNASSPAIVNLGSTADFVILSGSGISSTGTTSIVGDIGVGPAVTSTAITGNFALTLDSSNQFSTSTLVNGKIYAYNYAVPTPAKINTATNDMTTAYNDAAGRVNGTGSADYIELGAGDISGMTLTPGIYKWGPSTSVLINNNVVLDCQGDSNGVFIFQIANTLNIASSKQVILNGSCQSKNIFWQVASTTTLGTTSVLSGNILDATNIAMLTGATLNGRALAQTAVTLDSNNISIYTSNATNFSGPVFIDTNVNNILDSGEQSFYTIQAAIDAATSGDIIDVTPGTYNQDEANSRNQVDGGAGSSDFNIFVDKSVTIQGVDNNGNVITNYDNVLATISPKRQLLNSGHEDTIFVQADNVVISGFTILGWNGGENTKTVEVIGNNVVIKNSVINAMDGVSSIYMYDPKYDSGTDSSHLQSYRIEGNLLDGGGAGLYGSGIRFSSGAGWSGDVANRVIIGNKFENVMDGIEFVGPQADLWDVYPVGAATITNNEFTTADRRHVIAWGNYKGNVGYSSLDWNAILTANTFDKSVTVWTPANEMRTWDCIGCGSTGDIVNIAGIYTAIKRYPIDRVAQSGDTIKVGPGTYTETGQIVISKNVSIVGVNKLTTIIKPSTDTAGNNADSAAWFLINTGVNFNLSNVTLDGDAPTRLINWAIASYGDGTINNNIIKNIKAGTYSGRGIVVFGNITVSNNTFSNIERIGVHVRGAYSGPAIGNALITGNTYVGKGSGDFLDYGIEVGAGASAIISNNAISNCKGVTTNDGSTSAGILVTDYYGTGTRATITGNTISNCTEAIAVGYSDIDNTVVVAHENRFVNNDISISSTHPFVNATYNYWGSANPNFTAVISGNVSYAPWYTTSALTTNMTDIPTENQTLADSEVMNVTENSTDILVPVGSPLTNINVPNTIEDTKQVTLDLSLLTTTNSVTNNITNVTTNFTSVNLSNDLTLSRDTLGTDYSVTLPSGTTISGPEDWNGIMNVPTVNVLTSVTPTVNNGMTNTVLSVVEVGYGDTKLTFDNAARLVISGQAGKLTGYSRAGVFTKILNVCLNDTQVANDLLPIESDCKIDVGNDLIIWTKHFTQFVTYSEAAAPVVTSSSGGGSSGGSSGGIPLQCETWSTCNSEGVSSQICYTDNSNTTLTRTKSCTPGQATVPKQNTTTPIVPTTNQNNNEQNTVATNQNNNGNTSNSGNLITGNVALESSPTGIWSTIGNWWNQFAYWITHIFG
jgi:hypothetical protein